MTLASAFTEHLVCAQHCSKYPLASSPVPKYRWERAEEHGKITLCAQVPTASRWTSQHLPSGSALLCRPFFTTRRWHFPPGCFSPRLESSSMVSFFSLITLLFKYLSPLPRTAELPQLQHLSLLFLGLGAGEVTQSFCLRNPLGEYVLVIFSDIFFSVFQKIALKVYSLREEETECLPCPAWLTCTNSLNLGSNPVTWILLLPIYRSFEQDTDSERCVGLPRSLSQSIDTAGR